LKVGRLLEIFIDTAFFTRSILHLGKWSFYDVVRKLFTLLTDLFPEQLLVFEAYLIAFDTSLIAKNSKKITGVQKWKDHSGNADSGEFITGHHWGILGIVGKFFTGRFLCFPLIFRLITGKKQLSQWICDPDGNTEPMGFWHSAHAAILQFASWVCKYPVRVVADAYFSNQSFIKDLVERDNPIHVITRLKSNTVGYEDPDPPTIKKRGRPRKKGKKVKILDLFTTEPIQVLTVELYGETKTIQAIVKDLWTLDLNRKVRVVVTKVGNKINAFISTDLSLSPAQIIEIYGSRFSIEIAIRDMKQNLGLEDYQHQSLLPTLRFLHLVAVAYCIGKIVLLKYGNCSWLQVQDNGDTPWTSVLSFKRIRTCLRKYAMAKLVFSNTALDAEVAKNTTLKDAILTIAS